MRIDEYLNRLECREVQKVVWRALYHTLARLHFADCAQDLKLHKRNKIYGLFHSPRGVTAANEAQPSPCVAYRNGAKITRLLVDTDFSSFFLYESEWRCHHSSNWCSLQNPKEWGCSWVPGRHLPTTFFEGHKSATLQHGFNCCPTTEVAGVKCREVHYI